MKIDEKFRCTISLSPFTSKCIKEGYTFEYNGEQISTMEEFEKIYINKGAIEQYVFIATKKSMTSEDIIDGEIDTNANVHIFYQAMVLCQIAKDLDIPINPEVMLAYTYMDMEIYRHPDFMNILKFINCKKARTEQSFHQIK